MKRRLAYALAAYAILIGIAAWRLSGKMLYAVLIMFGYFIVRTLIAARVDRR